MRAPRFIPQGDVAIFVVHAGNVQIPLVCHHHLTGFPVLYAVKIVPPAINPVQDRDGPGFPAQLFRHHHRIMDALVDGSAVFMQLHHDHGLLPRLIGAAHKVSHNAGHRVC